MAFLLNLNKNPRTTKSHILKKTAMKDIISELCVCFPKVYLSSDCKYSYQYICR